MYRGNALSLLSAAGYFLIFWLGVRFLLPIIFPFLLGLGLALLAEPLVKLLHRKLKLPRAFSAGVGVSLTVFALAILIVLICAFAVRELGLLSRVLPDLEDTARSGIALVEGKLLTLAEHTPKSIRPALRENVKGVFSDGTALLNRAVQYVLGLAGRLLTHVPDSALTLGTGIIAAFMISAKLPRLRRWLLHRIPREKLEQMVCSAKRLKSNLGGWLLAQVKLSGVTAAILLAGLFLLRISYAPLWAVGISLVDAFPVLGTGTVLLPWALILYLQGDVARAVGVGGLYVVVSVVRSVLEPRLVGKQLGLDPLVTLMALYTGYKLSGLAGMLLAPLLTVTAMQLIPKRSDKL